MKASARFYFAVLILTLPVLLISSDPLKKEIFIDPSNLGSVCEIGDLNTDWQHCQGPDLDLLVSFYQNGCLSPSQYNIIITKIVSNVNVGEYQFGPFDYVPDMNTQSNLLIPGEAGCNALYKIKVEDIVSGEFKEINETYCCDCSFSINTETENCVNNKVKVNFELTGDYPLYVDYTISGINEYFQFTPQDEKSFLLNSYCGEDNLFIITFQGDNFECSREFAIEGDLCCSCVFGNIEMSPISCEGNEISFYVDMNYQYNCNPPDWNVSIGSNTYPMTWTGIDFYVENIINTDSILFLNFCSEEIPSFCQELEVVNPCYSPPNPPDPCSITSFLAWQDTVCNNGQAVIRFEYNANSTFGSEGYYVVVDSNSYFFESNDEKIILYPAYCNNNVTLLIYDANDPTCNLSDTLSALCCACGVDSVLVNTSSCDSGLFNITLAFDGLTGSCQYGSWTVEVSDSIYQTTILNNSWAVAGISSLDKIITYEICSSLGECFTTMGLNPCFDTTTVTPLPCQLDSFHVFTLYDCNEGFITNGFTIQGSNFGSNGYFITDGLNVYHFENNEPQEFSSFGSCTGDLIITLYDATDSLCTLTDTINPCCECLIDSFFVSAVCDSNDLISINLELFDVEGYCALNGWTVTVNNVTYPMFINNDNIYVALNVNSQDTIMNLTFCTKTGQQHCFSTNKVNPCLTPTNLSCKMSDADIEIFDQSGITAKIAIENNNNCGVKYNIWADNIEQGTFTAFENIVYVPLNIGNIPVIDFKICSVEPNIDCIGEQVANPYFINQVKDELSEISINYNEGSWEIVNPNNNAFDFNLYNSIGQLVYKRSLNGEDDAFVFQPQSTGIYMVLLNIKAKNKSKAVFIR